MNDTSGPVKFSEPAGGTAAIARLVTGDQSLHTPLTQNWNFGQALLQLPQLFTSV